MSSRRVAASVHPISFAPSDDDALPREAYRMDDLKMQFGQHTLKLRALCSLPSRKADGLRNATALLDEMAAAGGAHGGGPRCQPQGGSGRE